MIADVGPESIQPAVCLEFASTTSNPGRLRVRQGRDVKVVVASGALFLSLFYSHQ